MRLLGRSRPCRRPCALQSMEPVRPSRRATEKTLFRGRASLDACGCSLDGTRCEKHRSRAPQSRTGVEEIEMFSARIESGKASDEPVMNSTGATSSTGPAVMFGLDSHGNVRSVSRPTSPAAEDKKQRGGGFLSNSQTRLHPRYCRPSPVQILRPWHRRHRFAPLCKARFAQVRRHPKLRPKVLQRWLRSQVCGQRLRRQILGHKFRPSLRAS